jgi:hypothetical protein
LGKGIFIFIGKSPISWFLIRMFYRSLDAISKWEISLSISIGPPGGMGKSIFKMGATLILKTKSFFSKISFPEPLTGFFTEPD